MKPNLFVFSGLPGAGKTTIARELAGRYKAAYFRLDTIEHGLKELCAIKVQGEGYGLAHRMAADTLAVGTDVVVDCCNPWELTRSAWEAVAARCDATCVNIEIVCANRDEHRRRAAQRENDIAGFTLPTWEEIEGRDYHAWPEGAAITVDTTGRDAAVCVKELIDRIESMRTPCGFGASPA